MPQKASPFFVTPLIMIMIMMLITFNKVGASEVPTLWRYTNTFIIIIIIITIIMVLMTSGVVFAEG